MCVYVCARAWCVCVRACVCVCVSVLSGEQLAVMYMCRY